MLRQRGSTPLPTSRISTRPTRIGAIALTIASIQMIDLAYSETLKRLPFSDGTYVTTPALCDLSMEAMVAQYGDRVSIMVYNIRGDQLDNGYEMHCEIRNIKRSGKKLTFKVLCEVEGEIEVDEFAWTALDEKRFQVGDQTYSSCGRFL